MFKKNNQLIEESDTNSEYEDISEEDISESDEESKPIVKNKRLLPEDPRNKAYLKNFREKAELDQANRY